MGHKKPGDLRAVNSRESAARTCDVCGGRFYSGAALAAHVRAIHATASAQPIQRAS